MRLPHDSLRGTLAAAAILTVLLGALARSLAVG